MRKDKTASLKLFLIYTTLFIFMFLTSCHKPSEIHLHDRHRLSYDLVKAYAETHGPLTLVLLDYHHDIRPEIEYVNSVNWVGKLVEEDYVKKVIWLSGKKLLLPNRESRMAWLERSLTNAYPETAEKMRNAVQLVDWYDLQELKFGGRNDPFVITLDFDVFTKDPGNPPELFVDELCSWIQKQKPELVTLAFSAAYQPEPDKAWEWLNRFIRNYKRHSAWYLESGEFGEKEESRDDILAHNQRFFYSGAYLWQNTPEYLRKSLGKKEVGAGNKAAEEVLGWWKDKTLLSLKKTFNEEKLKEMAKLSKTTMYEFFEGKEFKAPNQNIMMEKETYGVAVRFRNSEEDRGCLSLYTGIAYEDMPEAVQYCAKEALIDPRYMDIQREEESSLITNISVFSGWKTMNSCFDFTPGIHSLILEDLEGEKTLLQTAIALEHNYSREEFLARLSNKAGLGFNGWKNEGISFYKAETVSTNDR